MQKCEAISFLISHSLSEVENHTLAPSCHMGRNVIFVLALYLEGDIFDYSIWFFMCVQLEIHL